MAAINRMPHRMSQRIGPRTEESLGVKSIRPAAFPPRPIGVGGAEGSRRIAPSQCIDTTRGVEAALARSVTEGLISVALPAAPWSCGLPAVDSKEKPKLR